MVIGEMRLKTIIFYGLVCGVGLGLLTMFTVHEGGGKQNILPWNSADVKYDQPGQEPQVISVVTPGQEPQVIPVVTPVSDISFDIDVDTGALLYKKDDCVILIKELTNVNDAESGICTDSDWENVKNKFKSYKITPKQISIPISTPRPTISPTPRSAIAPVIAPIVNENINKPFENVWDFVRYAQNNWKYVTKANTDIVQTPQESYMLLGGDCQDFSSMIAYYLQEVYNFDTEIIIIAQGEGKYHAVAFVLADQSVIDDDTNYCGVSIPIVTNNDGRKYVPIDWTICPGWSWVSTDGKLKTYEWNDFAGKIHG